ncbi:hypothetical protein RB195_023007 [Necator americanus]|uniref:Reverse transcriptase/retrotransposon-derived protein RNase H-like domain-containing protein n=1 Tax=Necator americanus TaxID=51031 RepID=A0ABR1EHE6_NECAM
MGSTYRRRSEEKWIDPLLRRLLSQTERCTGTKPASSCNPSGHLHETQWRTLLFTARLSRSISPIVDDAPKQLLTIKMHRGLYPFNRLPFGVKPAPGIFQQYMDALIAGLDGTAAYLNDILVTFRTIGEHNARLETVFKRIQDYGLDRCAFLQTEITYPGLLTNAQGRRPGLEKIKAIQKLHAPKDVSQLRSFLELINFYGNFVKDLHNLGAPLDTLTKKDVVYTWTPECQSSLDKIKAILSSDLLLTHFDPSLPIIVATDTSNYGMEATLSHRFADGCEKVPDTTTGELQPD